MAVDYIVARECPAKTTVGHGDPGVGTFAILEKLNWHNRTEAVRQHALAMATVLKALEIQA